MQKKHLIIVLTLLVISTGCKDAGFRKIEGANEKATVQSALEALQQIELALSKYKEINRTYPHVSEASLYDTLKNYFVIPIDPNHIYRNESDQSSYIAIGGRKNKVIYRYPATLGSGEYTLYWTGINGIDEEGRGDDIFASRGKAAKQLSRKLVTSFRGDSLRSEFSLSATGSDFTKDSVKFQIRSAGAILYSDWWPIGSYVSGRSELSEAERQETVNLEFDRFLHPVHFMSADTLLSEKNFAAISREVGESTLRNLAKKKLPVFTYFSGSGGVKAIFWNPQQRKIDAAQISYR
jgi:hypothetical protein